MRARDWGTDLTYISIDGDDVGRRVTAKHLANDALGLGMRTLIFLLALFPSVALAQKMPSPAGVAYRICIENAAVRYAHVAGSIAEAVDIAFISCVKERDDYLGIHPPNEAWSHTMQTIRDRIAILIADERLKRFS